MPKQWLMFRNERVHYRMGTMHLSCTVDMRAIVVFWPLSTWVLDWPPLTNWPLDSSVWWVGKSVLRTCGACLISSPCASYPISPLHSSSKTHSPNYSTGNHSITPRAIKTNYRDKMENLFARTLGGYVCWRRRDTTLKLSTISMWRSRAEIFNCRPTSVEK